MQDSISKMEGRQEKVVAVLRARIGSERLPGKVLTEIIGCPMLEVIVRRVRGSTKIDEFIAATTKRPEDDAVAECAEELGVKCFRGADEDCLDRVYSAAREQKADVVVQLTGDNPLVDGHFIDMVIGEYFMPGEEVDYVDTTTDGSFPYGLSVEVVSMRALEEAWNNECDRFNREHVTQYILKRPEEFRLKHLASPEDNSSLRWTVDTHEDLVYVRRLFEHFGEVNVHWEDFLDISKKHPEWREEAESAE